MKLACAVLCLLAISVPALSLNILSVVPWASKSHFAIGNSISKSLSKIHDVTLISPYFVEQPADKYRKINYIEQVGLLEEYNKMFNINSFEFDMNAFMASIMMPMFGRDFFELHMQNKEMRELMESEEKFDVCIFEVFMSDAFLGLGDHFDCTIITYTTLNAVTWVDMMTANQSPYSYVPHPFLHYTENMNFWQRLHNTAVHQFDRLLYTFYQIPSQRNLYKKYFPNAKRTFDEMLMSSSIMFVHDHVSISSARPYVPNIIEIGGIHIDPPKKLPEDIKAFLDSATEGAILFSMGSIVKAVEWPIEKREALVNVFKKLKMKVLWKYENDTLPNKPDNVMISPWIPQRDILAHPNIKVFITHGGLLGTSEAVTEGIPLLGFPVFGDQKMNMERAVSSGYGKMIHIKDIQEENVYAALQELLTDPKYKENAKLVSTRFNDRPMTPQGSVVYWTQYAHIHGGAKHLQPAAKHLSFIELHLIDVYATLVVIGLVLLFIDYLVLKCLLNKFCRKQKNVNVSKKKK